MNVDGVPNVRACTTPASAGMRVRHQNAYPSLEHDWLAIAQGFDWLMPVGWYYKAMTRPSMWHAAEPFIRKIAGLGEPPPKGSDAGEYEHSYRHVEVAIIGGGPAGLQEAVELGARGAKVMLIDDQPALGGHLRYSKRSGIVAAELIAQVQKLPNVEVLWFLRGEPAGDRATQATFQGSRAADSPAGAAGSDRDRRLRGAAAVSEQRPSRNHAFERRAATDSPARRDAGRGGGGDRKRPAE